MLTDSLRIGIDETGLVVWRRLASDHGALALWVGQLPSSVAVARPPLLDLSRVAVASIILRLISSSRI